MSESYDVPVKIILDRVAQSWRATGGAVAELVPAVEQAIGSKFQGVPKLRDDLGDAILRFQEAARQPEVVIATTGTTSSGKSTVANVLVGAELLPKAVQEMSAGVVTITHDEKVQRLRIAATKGAQWETGEWDDLEARETQVRLRDTMHAYLDALDGDVAVNRNDVEPPACFISWPTEMGRRSSEFGIPEGARLKILDLPGLKYVDDDLNGSVVRAKARNALCLVAYNSFETDPRKQTALLRQIVDQVRALGGSPARMLFLLNRIDAFLSDSDPEASKVDPNV